MILRYGYACSALRDLVIALSFTQDTDTSVLVKTHRSLAFKRWYTESASFSDGVTESRSFYK